jgi:hypothetical protein
MRVMLSDENKMKTKQISNERVLLTSKDGNKYSCHFNIFGHLVVTHTNGTTVVKGVSK